MAKNRSGGLKTDPNITNVDLEVKAIECTLCKHYNGKDCHKKDNIGVAIKYRQERQIFVKKAEEINKDKNCKDYVELSKK